MGFWNKNGTIILDPYGIIDTHAKVRISELNERYVEYLGKRLYLREDGYLYDVNNKKHCKYVWDKLPKDGSVSTQVGNQS